VDNFDGLENPDSVQFAFVPHARIIRIDMRVHEVAAVAPFVANLKKLGKQVAADHVTDAKVYDACRARGLSSSRVCTLRARTAAGVGTSDVSATALRVMAMARDPGVSDRDIERAISTDPAIVLQLLRIVNSAAVGGRASRPLRTRCASQGARN